MERLKKYSAQCKQAKRKNRDEMEEQALQKEVDEMDRSAVWHLTATTTRLSTADAILLRSNRIDFPKQPFWNVLWVQYYVVNYFFLLSHGRSYLVVMTGIRMERL